MSMEWLVPPEKLETLLRNYLQVSDQIVWNRYGHFQNPADVAAEATKLSRMQYGAVRTAFLVEDHIPGYSREYMRLYSVDGDLDPRISWQNRLFLHFILRWCSEEDRHAHALEIYLRATGRQSDEELQAEMVKYGNRPYTAPADSIAPLCIYTFLQEKATQLFYQYLRQNVEAPILQSVLSRLAQDETRHFGFFAKTVELLLQTYGERMVPSLQEQLREYRMPLWDILDNYKRRSIEMMRAARGYHFQMPFDDLRAVVQKQVDAASTSRSHTWDGFLKEMQAIGA